MLLDFCQIFLCFIIILEIFEGFSKNKHWDPEGVIEVLNGEHLKPEF